MATRFYDRSLRSWVIEGTDGDDRITGRSAGERIWAFDGDDSVHGNGGDDRLYLGDGADIGYGDSGNDRLGGKEGDDYLNGGSGDDVVYGDDGDDFINLSSGNDSANGGTGEDYVLDGRGDDKVRLDDDHTGGDYAVAGEGHNAFWLDADDTLELRFDPTEAPGELSSNVVIGDGYQLASNVFVEGQDGEITQFDWGRAMDENHDGLLTEDDSFVGIRDTKYGEALHLDIDNFYAHDGDVKSVVAIEAFLVGQTSYRVDDVLTYD